MRVDLNDKRYFDPPPVGWQSAQLHEGDLLFTRYSGTPAFVGVCGLVTGLAEPLVYPDKLIRVRLDKSVALPSFVEKAANSGISRVAIESNLKTTSGQVGLAGGDLKLTPLPLPPLNEQRRIVDKIEALTARSRRAKEALDAVPALLDKLRQSILAAAFRGDLTKEWRAAHPDVEPASVLLDRIRKERRARWEEAELAKMRAKGSLPKDDKWKSKYVEPEPVNTDDLPELPEGWAWATLGDLGSDPFAPVQTGPFGAQLHSSEFVAEGVPVIAVGNLTGLGFRRDGLYYVTNEKAKQLARYDVQSGDLLFARSGATLGKVCIAPSYVQDWRMTGHILRVRLATEHILPQVAAFALHGAPAVVRQVQSGVRGMTRPGYNTTLLEQIAVPLPPLDEQRALLGALEELSVGVEATEVTGVSLVEGLSQLDSAILAKAFRGELVPQDPNDEPASALLERIRAERESGVTTSPTKKTRAKRTEQETAAPARRKRATPA